MSESITNYNISYSTNFKLEIPDAPHINYFLQQVTFPTIANNGMDLFYKHHQTSTYSNVTEWSPLDCNVLMDENFENYIYLADWMRSFIDEDDWRNLVKDIKVSILSGNKKILLIYTFNGAFPVSLGSITFDSSSMDPTQIQFNIQFRYQYFSWEKFFLEIN